MIIRSTVENSFSLQNVKVKISIEDERYMCIRVYSKRVYNWKDIRVNALIVWEKKEAEFYPSGYPQPYTWLGLHSPRVKCIDIESRHRKILLKSTSAKYPRSCYGIDWREIWTERFSKIDSVLSLPLPSPSPSPPPPPSPPPFLFRLIVNSANK